MSLESELNTSPKGKLDSLVNFPRQIRNITIFAKVLQEIKKEGNFPKLHHEPTKSLIALSLTQKCCFMEQQCS